MATALVVRAQRYKKIGDKTSPLVYILKRKPRDAKMYDLKRISEEIEALGGMSAEDVLHVGKAIVRNMREKLTDGNSVRLDDFGIFRTSFHCIATENPKDCTVKNIDKVRINFKVARAHPTISISSWCPTTTRHRAVAATAAEMPAVRKRTRWDKDKVF